MAVTTNSRSSSSKHINIDSCVSSSGNAIQCPSFPQYTPCSCVGECDILACDCVLQHGSAYDKQKKLKENYLVEGRVSNPVIECSRFCSCNEDCINKTSQKGSIDCLYVDNAGDKGLGVYASKQLERGTFVCEYVGELIRIDEYKARLIKAQACYSIKIVEHLGQDRMLYTCIDASYYGNISRYFNHSCSPNMTVVPVRSDCVVPRICLFTNVVVGSGQELCFSYCDMSGDIAVSLGTVKCYCGSEKCRGYLPLQV